MEMEKHYTTKEIAEAWQMSPDTVQRMFAKEPGVIVFESEPKKYKRRRRTLRIPESVLFRVYQRKMVREKRA